MGEMIRLNLRGHSITVGFGSALLVLAIIVAPIFLVKRWSDNLWEEQAMVATNMFRPLLNQNKTNNATMWERIAKTQQMLKCSPSAVCSPSWLQLLRKRSYDQEAASCPFYFKWIRQDLKPWAKTGIRLDMVEAAKKWANFRLTIVNGRMYVESYRKSVETRDLFTIWGIAQLLKFYPGMVPDLELMFSCDDRPVFRRADFTTNSPPPLFRYCGTEDTLDIAFPDWSFWGWAEVRTPKWEKVVEEIVDGSREVKWEDRDPMAYWKGNPFVAGVRGDLMKCNNTPNWNGRLYIHDWEKERREGFLNSKLSKLSKQCYHRFKIYIEGYGWSVSLKNILACDSPTLFITPHFYDFFLRGLAPRHHYWPIRADKKCDSIQFAVNWGNNHTKEAKEIGKAAREFILNDLKMSNVYDYMFHVLNEYSKLLKYKPSVPKNAAEYCSGTIVCFAKNEAEKEFMNESMITNANSSPPCKLGDEEHDERDIKEFLEKKSKSMDYVKQLEEEWAKSL